MRRTVLALAVVLGASLIVMSCNPLASGSANASRVVTGTITVANNSYWASLVLGVFSGGDLGTYPTLATHDQSFGARKYRIIYDDTANTSAAPIPPLAGAVYSISDTSGTSSAYSFELPATIPMYQMSGSLSEYYYYAAWIDGNSNNTLDLKDADPVSDQATTVLGEFNRCATKATHDTFDLPTTIVIDRFQQSLDLNGSPTGNYKYAGFDEYAYNEQQDLTTDTNGGFNFNISATSGW